MYVSTYKLPKILVSLYVRTNLLDVQTYSNISITYNVKKCKKFNETVQMANFTVFTMCGRELPAILRGTANAETVGQNQFF